MGGQLSPWLVQAVVLLGTWLPFERVPNLLTFFTGVTVSAETARRLTETAGKAQTAVEEAEVERIEHETPASPPGPPIQQLSADGAMVQRTDGQWLEVRTLVVGTVESRVRLEEEGQAHARDLSYFSRQVPAERFTRLALGELHRRGTERAGVVVAPMDGAEWEQTFLDVHRPNAVRILDFPHAVQHLATAVHAVLGEGTPAAEAWLTEQAHTLKGAGVEGVLAALRGLPVEQAADPSRAKETRDGTVRYLEKRRDQVRYPEFLAKGYPIGSGSVESANKVVVEARMKGAGMRWGEAHVDPMVALRGVVCSGRWASAWPVIQARLCRDRIHVGCRRPPGRAASVPQPPPPDPVPPHGPPKEKLVVKGRPTPKHPWKRFRSHPQRAAAKT